MGRRRRGYYDDYRYSAWGEYVPVAERRAKAEKKVAQLRKKGHPVDPVVIDGRSIATTFWGKSWCKNLESYSDYSNRLPRGRMYVRNGSVVDLQIQEGQVSALVAGSSVYTVNIQVSEVPTPLWESVCSDCSQSIDSLVELLQGKLSKGVMERICQQRTGLFPTPREIHFHCSCPDSAYMCKHVAAVLYGVGSRLDQRPELLFQLRRLDPTLLIGQADTPDLSAEDLGAGPDGMLGDNSLAELFGIEMETGTGQSHSPAAPRGSAADKVLNQVHQHRSITLAQCRKLFDLDLKSARAILDDLTRRGLLVAAGSPPRVRYVVGPLVE